MAALSLSVLLFLLGLTGAIVSAPSRLTRLLAAIMAGLILLLSSAFVVSDYFTGNGITATVAFHLGSGFLGAGVSEHVGLGIATFVAVAAASVMVAVLFRIMPRLRLAYRIRFLRAASVVLLMASFAVHPAVHDAWQLAPMYWPVESTEFTTPAASPPEYLTPEAKGHQGINLVFLYLEGLEQSYFDDRRFPGLVPELSALRDEAVVYTDISSSVGSQWTIAGMVSSQCGIPLLASSGSNAMEGVDRFLPETVCIGDILNDAGYRLAYMGGADLSFAGKGNFYRSHGFHEVQGRAELKDRVPAGYLSSWGLYDDSLFTELTRKFDALASGNQPFGLFGLTLDTHHPTGHPSRSCEKRPYGDGESSMLNAVHCTDRLAAEFINHVRRSEHGDETIIVITSDHLALRSDITPQLEEAERRNLLMVIPPSGEAYEIDKPGTTLDIAATVLDWLGLEADGLGFGRNLNTVEQSLREAETDLSGFLLGHKNFLDSLWQYPQLTHGVALDTIDPDGALILGNRRVTAPTIFKLDDEGEVFDMILASPRDRNLLDDLQEISEDEAFLWVDRCKYTADFANKTEGAPGDGDQWCGVAGALSAGELKHWRIGPQTPLEYEDLTSAFSDQAIDSSLAKTRRKKLLILEEMSGRRGINPVIFKLSDDGEPVDIVVTTARDRNLLDDIHELSDDERFLWVDRCRYIDDFVGGTERVAKNGDQWCGVTGSLSAAELTYLRFTSHEQLEFAKITSSLSDQVTDAAVAQKRRKRLRMLEEMGGDPRTVELEMEVLEPIQIKSAGYGFGESFVRTRNTQETLNRGLTLIGIDRDGGLMMHNEDTCGLNQDRSHEELLDNFQSAFRELTSQAAAPLALVAHDSAVCDTEDLVEQLGAEWGIGLDDPIGYREPYIAIFHDGSVLREFNAAEGMAIAVELVNAP